MNSKSIGFVKLSRKLLDWQWYDDVNTKAVFLHLLLTANFTDRVWHGLHIGRGDVLTSVPSLCDELGLTESKVRTALKHLKVSGEITESVHRKYRVISVIKYDYYLSEDSAAEEKSRKDDGQITDEYLSENGEITCKTEANKENLSDNSLADIGQVTDISRTDIGQVTDKCRHNKKEKKENTVKKREAAPRFAAPALEDIAGYISQKGYRFSAERFYSYYTARGWKTRGENIVNWQAVADNWASRNYEQNEVREQKRSSFDVDSLDALSMFND